MTVIDAKPFVRAAFPPEEGAKFARALLEQENLEWNNLSIDLTSLPSSLLISAFFNSFLQTIFDTQPDKLDAARAINWQVKFPFQEESVAAWMKEFQPYTSP